MTAEVVWGSQCTALWCNRPSVSVTAVTMERDVRHKHIFLLPTELSVLRYALPGSHAHFCAHGPSILAFGFADGDRSVNSSVTLSDFNFCGGNAVGPADYMGTTGVSGDLGCAVTPNNSAGFTPLFTETFNPGVSLSFLLSITNDFAGTARLPAPVVTIPGTTMTTPEPASLSLVGFSMLLATAGRKEFVRQQQNQID